MSWPRVGLTATLLLALSSSLLRADEAEERAVQAILGRGGRVTRDEKKGDRPVVAVDLTGATVTAEHLKELKAIKGLRTLALSGSQLTDEALRALREAGLLHVLQEARDKDDGRPAGPSDVLAMYLTFTRVTDEGLKELRDLKNLQRLGLPFAATDAGLKELKAIEHLRAVSLNGTRVTEAGLRELQSLKGLEEVQVSGSQLSDAGLRELTGLKTLRTLALSSYDLVTDELLRTLRKAGLLHVLWLARAGDGGRPSSAADVSSLDLSGTKVTEAALQELKDCRGLRTLYVPFEVADGVLRTLREFDLVHALALAKGQDGCRPAGPADVLALDLSGTKVTDAAISDIKAFVNLRRLGLPHRVTDEGVRELKHFRSLESLRVCSRAVTDEGVKGLGELKGLASLDLTGARLTDAGLKAFENLTGLQELSVSHTGVTDAGLKQLQGLKGLRKLYLGGTKVTDAGLKELKSFPALQSLDLSWDKITDDGVLELAGLNNLVEVNLSNTEATETAVTKLKAALPRCEVYR